MRSSVGEIVSVTVEAKVAEKNKDGGITGRMIQLRRGDIGKIVSERQVREEVKGRGGDSYERKQRVFLISLANGMVTLRENSVSFSEDIEERIPKFAMRKAHPDYKIRDSDKSEDVDY